MSWVWNVVHKPLNAGSKAKQSTKKLTALVKDKKSHTQLVWLMQIRWQWISSLLAYEPNKRTPNHLVFFSRTVTPRVGVKTWCQATVLGALISFKYTRIVVLNRLFNFVDAVHHKWTIMHNRFINRFSNKEQYSASVIGLQLYPLTLRK